MTGLLRRATIISAVGLLAASAAMAAVPSASNSTMAPRVTLFAHTGGVPDPTTLGGGAATFTIRDGANNPVPNSVVILNFSSCTDVRVCPGSQEVGTTVNCGAKTVSRTTDALGVVAFRIVGAGLTAGAGSVTTACLGVTADGVPMTTLKTMAFDTQGTGGVTAGDVTVARNILAANAARTICDYNNTGTITAGDITIIRNNLAAAGNEASCAAYCVGWW